MYKLIKCIRKFSYIKILRFHEIVQYFFKEIAAKTFERLSYIADDKCK